MDYTRMASLPTLRFSRTHNFLHIATITTKFTQHLPRYIKLLSPNFYVNPSSLKKFMIFLNSVRVEVGQAAG